MGSSDQAWESDQLDQRPGLRKQIVDSPVFRTWIESLPSIDIDGEKLYLPWDDAPMDEDQVAYIWARDAGLIASTTQPGTAEQTEG